jgi:homoserine O-acetyltransferase
MNTVHFENTIELEGGGVLRGIEVAYHSFGRLNRESNNVIWVCHALTANSDVDAWWPGMVGPGRLFDTDKYFIICANILGSCYGSTGPLSVNPDTGKPYYNDFPLVSVRDMVKAHQLLRGHLGIKRIFMITGGSLGGQQALEWAVTEPELFDYLIPIATNAVASPWGIAFNESQRLAIEADCTFGRHEEGAGSAGMKAARSIALLSYRTGNAYNMTQEDEDKDLLNGFRAISYQRYQGDKLVKRFNAYSYFILSKALDSQNLGRKRGGVEKALGSIRAKTLALGINSDHLFPVQEQKRIAGGINNAEYQEIDSFYGHDGFLLEVDKITEAVRAFIKSE